MDSKKTLWQMEADSIVCRWSETGERIQYNPPRLQEASRSVVRSVTPEIPDFTTHSLLGSGEWFVPWKVRWSVPGKPTV